MLFNPSLLLLPRPSTVEGPEVIWVGGKACDGVHLVTVVSHLKRGLPHGLPLSANVLFSVTSELVPVLLAREVGFVLQGTSESREGVHSGGGITT